MHTMDGQRVTKLLTTWLRHADAFKQSLVELGLVPGASVAAISLDAGVGGNLLFK